MPDLGLPASVVEMKLVSADGEAFITIAEEFSFGRFPGELESWRVELFSHAGANLVEADQGFGLQFDGIGRHEFHPAIDTALGCCFGKCMFCIDQDFGVAIGGKGHGVKQEK